MRKVTILAVALMIGTGCAFAASVAIPWFVDNAPAYAGLPPTSGVTCLITIKNNLNSTFNGEITYYNESGQLLGPPFPNNTFEVAANAAVAFRPVRYDYGQAGGQEGLPGSLIPDRPRGDIDVDGNGTIDIVDGKKNGSCTITWVGGAGDLQGQLAWIQNAGGMIVSFAHLLPPGV